MKIIARAVFVLLLFQAVACAQKKTIKSDAVDRAVETEMKRQNIVGAAIGIIRQRRVVYTQGYGFANLEDQVPVTQETVFNWASNSKPVIAVMAMQLVESGDLDLDASVGDYVSGLPRSLTGVTVRHLLCHQSGLPHYSNGTVISTGKDVPLMDQTDPDESIKRFLNSQLLFTPGTKTDYSSYAYVLLSSVVQSAGKADIDAQLKKRITRPLRLNSFQLDFPFDQQPNWTFAYRVSEDGPPERISDTAHFWKHGAGAYKSDIEDFAKWSASLMSKKLLRLKTTREMWTAQKTADGQPTTRGLGFIVGGSARSLKISHNGTQDEARTRMVLYPNKGHGMVVMCNCRDADPGAITTAVYKAINEK